MESKVIGLSSTLPMEHYDKMIILPIVEKDIVEVGDHESILVMVLDVCNLFLG